LVEEIVDISPAYSADKAAKQKKIRKPKRDTAPLRADDRDELLGPDARSDSNHNHRLHEIVQ
jgi:hypothetical protein